MQKFIRLNLALIIAFTAQFATAQSDCSCQTELEFVIDYYEKNLPGFKDNVSDANKNDYVALKQDLINESRKVQNEVQCFKTITYFVEFFKDNHSKISMSMPNINDNNPEELEQFINSKVYQSRETYMLTEKDLIPYAESDIRGLYQTENGSYTIAVIPNKQFLRDYIGVIVESKSKLWKRGQVKLEIKEKKNGGYEAFSYMKNHSLSYSSRFPLNNGILGGGWFKTSKMDKVNQALNYDNSFKITKVNDSTAYLRIPTFSGYQTAKIDSLYSAAAATIKSTPYLIIDVRNNGGGSDANALPLLAYMYTNPVKTDRVHLYVTEDNIKMWESWYEGVKKDTVNYSDESREWFANQIKMMKESKPNSFILRSSGETYETEVLKEAPKKIAIIQNRYCASSCETLLFWAKQSSRTILVGENSGGFVGYGEVGSLKTPCYGYTLYSTMTRYEEQRKYEADGISPDYQLNYKEDWIEQTIKILSESRSY